MVQDLHQEWETFQTRVVPTERGDRAVLTIDIHARGRASGWPSTAICAHLVEFRDGMILRLEAFRDKDAAMQALEAT